MASFSREIKECPGCKCNYLAVKLRSFNSFGAKYYTDGSMSNCSVRAEKLLVCPKCSATGWDSDVKTVKSLSEGDYMDLREASTKESYSFLNAMPEFSGSSASDILSLLKDEPWNCQDQEWYLRINLWRAVGRLHIEHKGRADVFRIYLEKQVSEYANSQPLKAAEALHELGRNKDCIDYLESHPLSDQLEANMMRILELSKDSLLISAELLRQMGRFEEAVNVLSGAYPESESPYAKRIAELASSGYKWLAEIN